MEYLKRKSESILNWAHSIDKQVFNEKTLRKYLTTLKLSKEDVDLMLAHLRHSDCLV
jgi:hypothetical protein